MLQIEEYFEGEKWQCVIGIIISFISLGLSIYCFSTQKSFLNGIAYPFVILSILLISICIGVVIRSLKDTKRVVEFYENAPRKIQTEELPRMAKVMKSFAFIKKIEIVFILIGALLMLIFWKNELVKGIGLGLLLQGIMLYTFDHLAEARGAIYLEFLKTNIK